MNAMTGFASSFGAVLDLGLDRRPSLTTGDLAAVRRAFLLCVAKLLACRMRSCRLGPPVVSHPYVERKAQA